MMNARGAQLFASGVSEKYEARERRRLSSRPREGGDEQARWPPALHGAVQKVKFWMSLTGLTATRTAPQPDSAIWASTLSARPTDAPNGCPHERRKSNCNRYHREREISGCRFGNRSDSPHKVAHVGLC